MNAHGRRFVRGKALEDDLRRLIIDTILNEGGDVATGISQTSFRTLGRRYKVSSNIIKNIWLNFCQTGKLGPQRQAIGNKSQLEPPDLELISILKNDRPSMTHKEVKEHLEQHTTTNASVSAIGRSVRRRLTEGEMTWKKMIRPAAEKFTQANIEYCQMFINFMNSLDPHRVKFFDETGVQFSDCANPKYGHSVKGTDCVEVMRQLKTRNITANVLCGTAGVMYANTVKGASNTVEFLNFFFEASQATQPNGNPVLEYGDYIVMDNAAIHRFEGGRVLGEWLDSFGVTLIYLPTYSPELNPVELLFNKLKKILHRYEFRNILMYNIDVAVYRALSEISVSDLKGSTTTLST